MEPIRLWVVDDGDESFVFGEVSDQLCDVFGEALQEHEIVLKSPLTHALAEERDRLMWVTNALGGMVKDEARREAATVQAFVASWTLKQKDGKALPVTMEAVRSLHPVVSGAIAQAVEARVYPNPLGGRRWRDWLARQGSGLEAV